MPTSKPTSNIRHPDMETIIMVLAIVTILLNLIFTFFFYRARGMYPISKRFPELIIFMNLSLVTFELANIFIISDAPCLFSWFVWTISLVAFMVAVTLRCLYLLFQYQISKYLLKKKRGETITGKWYVDHRHWIRNKYFIRLVVVELLIFCTSTTIIGIFDDAYHTTKGCRSSGILSYQLFPFGLIHVITWFVIGKKIIWFRQ